MVCHVSSQLAGSASWKQSRKEVSLQPICVTGALLKGQDKVGGQRVRRNSAEKQVNSLILKMLEVIRTYKMPNFAFCLKIKDIKG